MHVELPGVKALLGKRSIALAEDYP